MLNYKQMKLQPFTRRSKTMQKKLKIFKEELRHFKLALMQQDNNEKVKQQRMLSVLEKNWRKKLNK